MYYKKGPVNHRRILNPRRRSNDATGPTSNMISANTDSHMTDAQTGTHSSFQDTEQYTHTDLLSHTQVGIYIWCGIENRNQTLSTLETHTMT